MTRPGNGKQENSKKAGKKGRASYTQTNLPQKAQALIRHE